jgi:hypothetical protein
VTKRPGRSPGTETWPLAQFPDLSPFSDPDAPTTGEARSLRGNCPPRQVQPKEPGPLTQGYREEGKYPACGRQLDKGFRLTLMSRQLHGSVGQLIGTR